MGKNAIKKYWCTCCLWAVVSVVFFPAPSWGFQKNKPEVDVKIQPANTKSRFGGKSAVVYKVYVSNYLTSDQTGNLQYTVTDKEGNDVTASSLELKINARKKLSSAFEIPIDDAGEYNLTIQVDLNNKQQTFNTQFSYSGTPAKGRKSSGAVVGVPITTAQPPSQSSDHAEEPHDGGEAHDGEEEGGEEDEEGEIIPVLRALKEDAVYYGNEPIKYLVSLSNKYKIKQVGSFTMIVEKENGEKVSEKRVDLKLPRKGMKKFYMILPQPKEPGVYKVRAAINTTTYDDTVNLAFGYEINKIKTPYYLPPDFDDFWKSALEELKLVDPQYQVKLDETYTTKYVDVFRIEMMGLGNVPFHAFLGVPKLKGKYPVLVAFGGYKIYVNPLVSPEHVTLSINVRNLEPVSQTLVNPDKREQIVINIDNKEEYIYKGIYTDCVRALDYLYSLNDSKIDYNRVVGLGGSQGATLAITTAVLSPNRMNAVVASNPVFSDWTKSVEIGMVQRELTFPFKNFREYLNENPGSTIENLLSTLHYFDLQNFVPKLNIPVLYAVGLLDQYIPPGASFSTFNKMNPGALKKSDIYVFPKLGHEIPSYHQSFIGNWILEQTAGRRKK